MYTLVVHQDGIGHPHRFRVERIGADGVKSAPIVEIASPLDLNLFETQLTLGTELRWYLEEYLDYPFPPNIARAERVLGALRIWGEKAFMALFGTGSARDFYRDAVRDGHENLQLHIASDDPAVLSWPWEALCDPQLGSLAHHCRIERRLDNLNDPLPLPKGLSDQRISILLITARPYQVDVAYRSVSRPLVDLINSQNLAVDVTILRPPTFGCLQEELRTNPGRYHIVHFDGHGAFSLNTEVLSESGYSFRGPLGQLIFETDDGQPDPVTALQLSTLLREYRIPIMVLNACQSGMLNQNAEDAFASVATALLRAGIRSVVAMSHSIYVSAAQIFLPAFYRRLFESGSVAEATRAGRRALLERPNRISARGPFPLNDWLVPVLYQQDPLILKFITQSKLIECVEAARLPKEIIENDTPYGFIGRDAAVLDIERALRRPPAGIVIHGLGGVGKTTLVQGFLEWLSRTGGLKDEVFWFGFEDIRSAEYIFRRLIERLLGIHALAIPTEQNFSALTNVLKSRPCLIIWDNFESATDIPGSMTEPKLLENDRTELNRFLVSLRGGKSKVLITSRGNENWLDASTCYRRPLAGLKGEERWVFCEAILNDFGISPDRRDIELVELLNSLDGHPLMMRAILPGLAHKSAKQLSLAIESYPWDAEANNLSQQKLYATLRFVEEGLPTELRPILYPVSLHENYAVADYLEEMAKFAKQPFTRQQIKTCLGLLGRAGLVQEVEKGNVHKLHPALTKYLRVHAQSFATLDDAEVWKHAFTDVMGQLAERYTPVPLSQQRHVFHQLGANFEAALEFATESNRTSHVGAIIQFFATYAQNRNDLPEAERLFRALVNHREAHNEPRACAIGYSQLGVIVLDQNDLNGAEAWYKKSLEIMSRLNDKKGIAQAYHNLGNVAVKRPNLLKAENWYKKSLKVSAQIRAYQTMATTYGALGNIAIKKNDIPAAEILYVKSLNIFKRIGDQPASAKIYYQLSTVADAQNNLLAAENYCKESLKISIPLAMEDIESASYQQYARISAKRKDFHAAEKWCGKSLELNERLGFKDVAAANYHQLGNIAKESRDFDTANSWYKRSLEIFEKLHDEVQVAIAYNALAIVAEEQNNFLEAETLYRKSLEIFDQYGVEQHRVAPIFFVLGNLANRQGKPLEAIQLLILAHQRSLTAEIAKLVTGLILQIYDQTKPDVQQQIINLWNQASLGEFRRPVPNLPD